MHHLALLSMLHIPQSGMNPDGPMRFQMDEAVRAREDHHYVSHMFTFQGVQALLPKNDTVECTYSITSLVPFPLSIVTTACSVQNRGGMPGSFYYVSV